MVYSSAYDPNKPIFTATTPPPKSAPPSNSPNVASKVIPPPSQGTLISNISGNWTISSLFSISFPKTSYYILINTSAITLNGGCNIYTYQYSVNSATQLITIGNVTQTNKSCAGSDDQLYVSGIAKMHKYLFSTSSTANSLIFYDQAGNPGYSLYSRITVLPTPQVASVNPFASGQALMLVLQRRDLARSIVTITANTITYNQCNNITHTYTVSTPGRSSGNITITGNSSTNNANCARSNDQIYISALNSAVSYVFDSNANTIVFSNM
jgi:hypothetical protein